MNDLQKREFEMLSCFVRICTKLDLTYYLVCGSALGAVKYKGFIPWDDDVDVAMPRGDYEIFLSRAPALLPERFFLQNHRTDPYYPDIFTKLRDSSTTYIEKSARDLPINHGIYIDIFPLDGYPRNPARARALEMRKWWYTWKLGTAFAPPANIKSRWAYYVNKFLGFHRNTQKTVEKLERILASFPISASDYICNHGNWQGKREYAPLCQYGQGVAAVFEDLPVRIPQGYDAYLRQKYGDYEKDPECQTGHHYCLVCDPDRPYTHYLAGKS